MVVEKKSHLAGLEPATFRLTAERANRLRHKCVLGQEPQKNGIQQYYALTC